jgi:HAD superfamily hydrolase (TIGR01509 family)
MPLFPRPYRIDAVLFDFDGTLTAPGAIDFDGMREQLLVPEGIFVLEHIRSLGAKERAAAEATLDRFEVEAAERSRPNAGAEDTVETLRDMGVPIGIVTRNSRRIVERALANFDHVRPEHFDVMVTRDDEVRTKPHPDPIHHAAARLGVAAENIAMVGDFVVDVQAGRAAGAVTVHLRDGDDAPDYEADFAIDSLSELLGIVRSGRPLPPGKLPNDILGEYLGTLVPQEALVSPGVGEDVAAVSLSGEEVLVVHSDPITLSGGSIARSAVTVNANDIATSGAKPRWFVTTVLLPAGTTPSQAVTLLDDLADACAGVPVGLVGGHTEVTSTVVRPVVSGTMLGTVERGRLRRKEDVRPGDVVLITKAVAIEGTALLARELRGRLLEAGATPEEIDGWVELEDDISVVAEAEIAAGFSGVHAMHDVTEGGVSTALAEFGAASGHRLQVEPGRIPVLPACRRVCDLLGADPLGLIGSGSLLIGCEPGYVPDLTEALSAAGIEACAVGRVTEPGAGLQATGGATLREFETDEAARLLG